ncbi:MAG: hypothetical protein HY344_02835 [Candidatus Levybacteria bacterium]|nr:hypothetical protein [Candidatus Levybacteria bacterium]
MSVSFLEKRESSIAEEILQGACVGEGIIVVHFDAASGGEGDPNPKIATVVERISKASSKRIAGQRSIPIETRKVGEGRVDNIRGGLAEMCDDETLSRVGGNLFLVRSGLGYTLCSGSVVGLSVLVYDGPLSASFTPINSEEDSFGGWTPIDEILETGDVRGIAKEFALAARDMGLIKGALRDFRSDGLAAPLFPSGFSINRYYEERERNGVDVKFTL